MTPLTWLGRQGATQTYVVDEIAGNIIICAAVNKLGAFKNKVEAKRGKPLADEVADQLVQYADNIIEQLSAELPEGKVC